MCCGGGDEGHSEADSTGQSEMEIVNTKEEEKVAH